MVNVIRGAALNFRRRFLDANKNLSVGGFSFPLLGAAGYGPSRVGFDVGDAKTGFVHYDAEKVVSFYPGYSNSLEFKSIGAPYAETVALRFGEHGFADGVNLEEFELRLLASRYAVPERLNKHATVAVETFQKMGKLRRQDDGNWENNHTARVVDWDNKERRITLQSASYFDQVATNMTLDWATGQFGDAEALSTLRTQEPHNNERLCPLRHSMLANTLGVAAVLVDGNGEYMINIRGDQQAIMAGTGGKFHCSASGVFELPPDTEGPQTLDMDVLFAGMRKEIFTELALEPEDYDLVPLAFSRELVRGGKPQLFFVAKTERSLDSLRKDLPRAVEAWEFISPGDLPRESPLRSWLHAPFTAPKELFTYEGLMAFAIAGAYLEGTNPPFAL